MPPVFPIFSLLAGFLGAGSALGQGNAAARAAEQNADNALQDANVADRNAVLTESQSADDERITRIQNRRALGSMRANFAASGFQIDGSALDVIHESAAIAEEDALKLRTQGAMKAGLYRQDAANKRSYAQQLRSGAADSRLMGGVGAGAAILGANTAIYEKYAPVPKMERTA